MSLRSIIDKLKHRNDIYNDLQKYDKAQSTVSERKLSSAERALNKILEQERQETIKAQLQKKLKKEEHTIWHKNVVHQPNIHKNHRSVLGGGSINDKQKSITKFK